MLKGAVQYIVRQNGMNNVDGKKECGCASSAGKAH